MTSCRVPVAEAQAARARAEVAERIAKESREQVAKTKERRRGLAVTSAKVIAKAREEAEAMRQSGDWSDALPRHLVVLHGMIHEHVYGVAPAESTGAEFAAAAVAAARMLKVDFGGDAQAMFEFIRWSWQREQDREEWRRQNHKEGGRLDWRRQFCQRGILTDYRVDMARKRGAA